MSPYDNLLRDNLGGSLGEGFRGITLDVGQDEHAKGGALI